jgi:type I restriction enzyme S subunit
MKFGLEVQVIENIISVLEQYPKVDKAFVFGSRAKGNYRPDSDIDIAIKGYEITTDDIITISVAIETIGITHKFDLLDYNSIKEPALKEHIDRVGIEFYSRWKECILTEMGTLQRGKSKHRPRYAFHLYGGSYPFIQTGQIREAAKYITKYEQTYSEDGLAQSKLWKKGTLCITIAANIAEIAILGMDACFPDSVLGFIPNKKKCNLDFAFYTLKYFQKELQQMGDGSVQDNINLGTFTQIKFPFPPLPEQTAIATILSSLDDKIDLLNRQNKSLEQLAETLFRQWFVEEAEENWEESCLSEIAKHSKVNVNPFESPTKLYKHFSLPAFDQGKEPIIEIGKEILSNKYKIVSDSILVSKLNPRTPRIWMLFGNINEDECICSTEFQIIKPKSIEWFGFVYCFLKSNKVTQELGGASSGTSGSHQRVNPQDIFNLSFSKPPLSLVQEFSKITNAYWIKIKNNQIQIRTLTQTRDTLLPKLMSGEVRVEM